MSTAYYKCMSPDVLAVVLARSDAIRELQAKGKIFADHFGGNLLVRNDLHGFKVSGLTFDVPKDVKLWTKPNQKQCNR